MTSEPTNLPFERLTREEPFVRQLARALASDDADDVVQETYLQVLRRGDDGVRSPRHWLARIARNIASNRRRGEGRRLERETRAASSERVPSSSELMEREERRSALVRAVDALDAPLRAVVLLRYFEGVPPKEIARELGVPVTTVWNRLRRALAILRASLEREHGDRRAWLLPLLPTARTGSVVTTAAGATLMTTKTKILTTVGALAAVILVAWAPWDGTSDPPSPGSTVEASTPDLEAPDRATEVAETVAEPEREELARPDPPPTVPATTGALAVRVLYGDEVLTDVGVRVLEHGTVDRMYETELARAGDDGVAFFASLAPGSCRVWTDRVRLAPYHQATIVAGETTELDVVLEPGIDIAGVVVDPEGTPVADAEVHMAPLAMVGGGAGYVMKTDAEGRFEIRACEKYCTIGARAYGYTQAPMRLVQARVGATVDVTLTLGAGGGAVAGRVVDGDGAPLEGASVVVGPGRPDLVGGSRAGQPVPAQARTDEDGEFLAIGIPSGEQPVAVRAPGYGVWMGTCLVSANATATMEITVPPGMRCTGTITTADGSPAAKADVRVGESGTLARFTTRTAADGTYELVGLLPGALPIEAELDDHGTAKGELFGTPGQTVNWDAKLSTGIELVGRVVLESGEGVDRVWMTARLDRGGWDNHATTGPDGRFRIDNCPEDRTLTVLMQDHRFERVQLDDVDPLAGELVVLVTPGEEPTATIKGIVVGPDGEPCDDAVVFALGRGAPNTGFEPCDADTGRFELGPLRPAQYRLQVTSEKYPETSFDLVRLEAHETWDVGTIRLVEGGRVAVELEGEWSGRIALTVRNLAGEYVCRITGDGAGTSSPIAPGSYHLSVSGREIAATTVPFEVRAGETTPLSVEVSPGHERTIEVAVPFEDDELRYVLVTVSSSNGEIVLQRSMGTEGGKAISVRCGFAPGDYTVSTTCEDHSGAERFSVDAQSGGSPPVRVRID